MSKPGFWCRNKLLIYDSIKKEFDFRIYMIYYLCFFALSAQSYADWQKAVEKILHDFEHI